MHQLRPLTLTALLMLGGCTAPGLYQPPVEDRTVPPPGAQTRVEPPDSGVRVTPVYDEPVIRQQRLETDPGLAVRPLEPAAEPVVTPSNPAVVALLDSARQQQGSGALAAAQTSLERAQRIAPRDPQVYYQLADVRRQMQQYPQAEQLALKGIALAVGQPETLRKLWLLIAGIRKDAGDLSGAQEALDNARRY